MRVTAIAIILCLPLQASEADPSQPVRQIALDLDGDARPETVSVYLSADSTRGFLTVDDDRGRWTSPTYRMWAAFGGDLDGDGRSEVVLGVWSDHPRHPEPEPHRAVWVLGWDGRRLSPRWRGSALARPVINVEVADLDGDDVSELVALETGSGSCFVTVYRWTGFGFAGIDRRLLDCGELELYLRGEALGVSHVSGRFLVGLIGETLHLTEWDQ